MTDPTPDVPTLRRLLAEVDFEAVQYNHRQGGLTCYDHPPTAEHPAWCCVCGEHGLTVSHRAHLATAIRAALAEVTP